MGDTKIQYPGDIDQWDQQPTWFLGETFYEEYRNPVLYSKHHPTTWRLFWKTKRGGTRNNFNGKPQRFGIFPLQRKVDSVFTSQVLIIAKTKLDLTLGFLQFTQTESKSWDCKAFRVFSPMMQRLAPVSKMAWVPKWSQATNAPSLESSTFRKAGRSNETSDAPWWTLHGSSCQTDGNQVSWVPSVGQLYYQWAHEKVFEHYVYHQAYDLGRNDACGQLTSYYGIDQTQGKTQRQSQLQPENLRVQGPHQVQTRSLQRRCHQRRVPSTSQKDQLRLQCLLNNGTGPLCPGVVGIRPSSGQAHCRCGSGFERFWKGDCPFLCSCPCPYLLTWKIDHHPWLARNPSFDVFLANGCGLPGMSP